MKINSIWILGFVLNLFFLYSIFQIYFQSPVVQISKTFYSNVTVPKFSRVVFYVCDGLRADTFFRNPTNHPYLTSLLHKQNAVWGISDTRVPTESRPGHIALFAGIYEDPSAIFTGWQKNLVQFDSVFNRTKYSVALGSPDIVDMFAEEAEAGNKKVLVESYPHEWQEFSKRSSSALDTWVRDRLKNYISKERLPKHDQLLIFLHLLGVDNTGHSFKPTSSEYLQAISKVDKIVNETEEITNKYYQYDNETLFVFTSDHGMTDWGSHGAGSPNETETPFIIWGKGIKANFKQMRINQADFSALISGALGTEFPTNSIGRFPPHIWNDSEFAFRTLEGNFKQLRELMRGKKINAELGRIPLVQFSDEDNIEPMYNNSTNLAQHGNYSAAIGKLEAAVELVMKGIVYYERYDQLLMTGLTVYAFVLWIVIIFIKAYSAGSQSFQLIFAYNVLDLCLTMILTFVVMDWSVLRIPYIFVPIYLTRLAISTAREQWRIVRNSQRNSQITVKDFMLKLLFTIFGIEIMVMTFYRREIISLGLILNAILCLQGKQLEMSQKLIWIGSVLGLAIFPTIPIIGLARNPYIISVGCFLCSALAITWIHQYFGLSTIINRIELRDKVFLSVQVIQISVSGILVHFPEFIVTRIFAWISIPSMFILPMVLASPNLTVQFLSIFLAILSPFTYLTLSLEVFFMPILFVTLLILLKLELNGGKFWKKFWFLRIHGLDSGSAQEKDNFKAFRLACANLCFVYISFFGIGNIASISSFDPTAAACFVTVFRPFVMMTLLLVKIVGPFLLVACAFRLLMTTWKEVEVNFTIVLCLCQGMSLHMFLNVTNVGSWLEIGTSISHFVIVQVTTLFLFILFFLANLLVRK